MAQITVTSPNSNELVVSSPYIQGLGSASRLGASQIEHTSSTNALVGDIFFKFYECNDSSGTKSYSPLDIESSMDDPDIKGKFLSALFPQYYYNSTVVSEIGTYFTDIAERLSGVSTPTNNLSSTLTLPSQGDARYVEFVGMGLGSYFGANFINGGTSDRPTQLWGTRAGQVHLTDVDPTVSPVNAIYDNTDAGCWQFSDYGCTGIIVYTNLGTGAFSASGLSAWSQLLCVWPIIAWKLSANYACIFNNLDQSFLQSGLGYFNRRGRTNTYYGWAGNYLQSIFNDWGIPVISPIWSMSDIAIATYLTYGTLGSRLVDNYGPLSSQEKGFRFVGPTADDNVTKVNEKTIRSLLPLLWANECRWGNSSSVSSAIPDFEILVTSVLGYASIANYVSACLNSSSEGYNAHIYRYILENQIPSSTPSSTRSYITSGGISWSSKLPSQASLLNVFSDSSTGYPAYYEQAIDSFYDISSSSRYGSKLKDRIEDGTLIVVDPMSSAKQTLLRNWVYVP